MDVKNYKIGVQRLNFSEKYKVNWFTPIRTASRACMPIMNHLNFDIISTHDEVLHGNFIENLLIMNVHNPYKRLFSIYNLYQEHNNVFGLSFDDWVKKNLNEVNEHNNNPHQFWLSTFYKNFPKKPDFIVKVESLYVDLKKIDFIDENDKEIKKIFSEYIIENKCKDEKLPNWKSVYNEKFASFIFENFKEDFEIFGYERDSWK